VCPASTVKESNPPRMCEQIICITISETYTCTDNESQVAQSAVTNCANSIFDIQQEVENGYYVPYDPTEGPSQDVNWPSLVAYGNCDNCHVTTKVPRYHALQFARAAVLVLWSIGAALVTVSFVWVCRSSSSSSGGPAAFKTNNNHQPTVGANTMDMVETPVSVVPAAELTTSPMAVEVINHHYDYHHYNGNQNPTVIPEATVLSRENESDIMVYGQPEVYPPNSAIPYDNNNTPNK